MRITLFFMVAIAALTYGAMPTTAASCESLASLSLPDTTINSARTIPAGKFVVPLTSSAAAGGRAVVPPKFDDLQAFCRITGTIKTSSGSSIKIEVWMPSENWNGKFLVNGYAFYAGLMDPNMLANALRQGYATATTDGGGGGRRDAALLFGEPEKVVDWGERAWHETTVKAKAIITTYYSRSAKYSYFCTCGGGSRQALKEAQRFPDDYEAVAAGGSAHDPAGFVFAMFWEWQAAHQDAASIIPASKLPLIHQAALEACDARDGLKDEIIQDPEHCQPVLSALQCKADDAADCLTASQMEAVRKIYAEVLNPRTKEKIYGPLMPGSELSWSGNVGPQPNGYAMDFFKYLLLGDPDWDYKARPVNFDGDLLLAKKVSPTIPAVDPDLTKFLNRGGKLLLYGGWSSTAIPPGGNVDYYTSVMAKIGANRKKREAVRLFMVADMAECPGGNGASTYNFDVVPILNQWRQTGSAPNQMLVSHQVNGVEDRQALVCPYPQIAMYNGTGNPKYAGSFVCKLPSTTARRGRP